MVDSCIESGEKKKQCRERTDVSLIALYMYPT